MRMPAMAPGDDDLCAIPAVYLATGGEFIVGLLRGELVAMGALRLSEDGAEIKRMRVHPCYQRQGYGRQILEHLEQRARDLGIVRLRLDTTSGQKPARPSIEHTPGTRSANAHG